MPDNREAAIGVAVVTFNAADVILDCLESLLAVNDTPLRIVVVDNQSTDGTVEAIRDWASGAQPYKNPGDIPFDLPTAPKPVTLTEFKVGETPEIAEGGVTLIHTGYNAGFAAGVNIGVDALAKNTDVAYFWVLNPDSVTTPHTPSAYVEMAAANPGFGLMGSRTCYMEPPDQIQIDGGTLNKWTGVTGNLNLGASNKATPPPDPDTIDFVMGANIIVNRDFYDQVGPMPEDYFLYYEEVEWALRGKGFRMLYCPDALIHHRAGTSIGSPTLERLASPFSFYFKHRGRMRFVRRINPLGLPVAYLYGVAKAGQVFLKGGRAECWAILAAIHGLRPPSAVISRLSEKAQMAAFGRTY